MLIVTSLTFLALTLLNYWIGKSAIYPGVAFCASWSVAIGVVGLTGDLFYPVSPETLFFFIVGGGVLTVACWVGNWIPTGKPQAARPNASVNRILTIAVWAVVIATPVFFYWIIQAVSAESNSLPFLMIARVLQQKAVEAGGDGAFRAAGLLIEVAQIIAVLCLWERKDHGRRASIAIVFAFLISIPFGQKASPFILAMALICVDTIQNRKMRWKLIAPMFFMMVAITAVFEFYVHLGGGSFQLGGGSFTDNTANVGRMFGLYASGGIAGFDRVIRSPNTIPQINPVHIMGLRIVRRFGANVTFPETAEFATIGPNQLDGNVYTIFWSYLNWGWVGDMLAVAFIAFISTRVYKRALQDGMPWVPIYAKMFFGLVFSSFTEYFVSSIYIYGIIVAVCWMIYRLPVHIAQFIGFNRSVVSEDLALHGFAPIEPHRPPR
jgi:oligosaccharide repeat unit polymerase